MTLRKTRLRDRLSPLWLNAVKRLKRLRQWNWLVYPVVCGVSILVVACFFYSSLRLQTLYSKLWSEPRLFDQVAQQALLGDWSAPLDDVFIHFDFARSTARGHPFEWLEGNGYSSGGTSLLYPFVLAVGYWLGFQDLNIMVWAGVIACVSVLAMLLAARRLFAGLPRWTIYLAPVFLLCTGVLNWTLFSGMEVALFLAFWGAALVAWDDLRRCTSAEHLRSAAVALGVACFFLVGTRPEAAFTVAIFALSATAPLLARFGRLQALKVLVISAGPGAVLVVGHAIANRLLTGDFTAAGALAKLEMHHPYLTSSQAWNAWWFHVVYQVRRVTEHHLSVIPWLGYVIWLFAALGVVFRRTRAEALLLWGCALAWILVVALNGQVRWQNERYTMPALAWLLLAAALGFGAFFTHHFPKLSQRLQAKGLSVGVALVFVYYQTPRFRDQVWFFGRASRNILDQHVAAGKLLRHGMQPAPRRILLSDAGAIPYSADLPALDLIGLGGYLQLPFARATRLGAAGGLELIERLEPWQRPDVFALYPSWWHTFPLWFGQRVFEVPVRGNVICGGASKVLYRADWTALEHSGQPFAPPPEQRLVDSLDLGDVISEKAHEFSLNRDASGHLTMKLLADPRNPRRGLWDGGRLLSPPLSASFTLEGLGSTPIVTLWFRVAPAQKARFDVAIESQPVGQVSLEPGDSWTEVPLEIRRQNGAERVRVDVTPREGGFALYHIWVTQPR